MPQRRVPQAGGIAVRLDGNRLSVLLVRAKRDPGIWIFPKGHIEPGETPEAAALRETREEAGVDGDLVGPVGAPLEFLSGQGEPVSVQYFLIRARSESEGTDGRAKQWFPPGEAMGQLTFEGARRLLLEALERARSDESARGPRDESARGPRDEPARIRRD